MGATPPSVRHSEDAVCLQILATSRCCQTGDGCQIIACFYHQRLHTRDGMTTCPRTVRKNTEQIIQAGTYKRRRERLPCYNPAPLQESCAQVVPERDESKDEDTRAPERNVKVVRAVPCASKTEHRVVICNAAYYILWRVQPAHRRKQRNGTWV